MSTIPRILLVGSDLFFSTQLRSAAEAAGAQADVELQPSRVGERVAAADYRVIAVDLETPGLDIAALIAALPAANRPHVLAFGPHVQVHRLSAARDAGCDTVVPRSVAVTTVTRLVAGPPS